MDRRAFIGHLALVSLAAPFTAEAQPTKIPRIGLLSPAPAAAAGGSPKAAKPADLPVRATHKVRAGHQPEDRQGARPDGPAVAVRRADHVIE
jgi:hypothetical protein